MGEVQAAAAGLPAAAGACILAAAAAAAQSPEAKLVGLLWSKSIWDGETGSCNGLDTYRPTVRGYAADAPIAGAKSDGPGSPTESSTTGTEWDMLQMPSAGSLRSGVPSLNST